MQILEGNTILPLYETEFKSDVIPELHDFNGMSSKDVEAIVNKILEGFHLLRRRRRLFISYKRTESRDIALQIYDKFESLNYDVFLDTHTVPKGSKFQLELWHRMCDSDVVILLDTENFIKSEWCEKELSFAIDKRISIIRLKFPAHSLSDAEGALMYRYDLNEDVSFANSNQLNAKTLEEISILCESVRARALAARQDNIVGEFITTATRFSKSVKRVSNSLLKLRSCGSSDSYFIPAIGVPISKDFQEVEAELKDKTNVFIIYDDTAILSEWINHLTWLNDQLRIKSIRLTEFNKWFKQQV